MLMDSNRTKSSKKRKKKNNGAAGRIAGGVAVRSLKIIGTLLLSLFLIIIITGSIFVTVLTIYVLNFADVDDTITLDKGVVSSNVTRFMYANPDYDPEDPDSEPYLLYYAIKNPTRKAMWIDLEEIPLNVQNAFICAEDERYRDHDGVDFKRTFSAIARTLLGTREGGSTITMQTIKNITGEDAANGTEGVERKIREIFRAINMEKIYTKDEILQCYLNIIGFTDGKIDVVGVQSAANYYFGKDVTQLTLAEAASIAATAKSPIELNPLYHPEENKYRRDWVLDTMLENGVITDSEHDQAIKEEIVCTGDPDFSSRTDVDAEEFENQGQPSYFMNEVFDQTIEILMEKKGISKEAAQADMYSGGYTVYTTCDINMQEKVEKEMQDPSNFQAYPLEEDELQSGFICIDLQGNVKATVGQREEKTDWDHFNNATDGSRSPGSCIKPIASYAPALEQDLMTYSTFFKDKPIEILNEDGEKEQWPVNYSEIDASLGNWSYADLFTWQMLMRSLNTCPAQLVEKLTPAYCYTFLKEKLDMSTLVESDINYAPVTVGGFTYGTKLQDLVAAYMIFGNGGRKYDVTFISSIQDTSGNIVWEKSDGYKQAISESTAYIMNKMMQKVVTESQGTGRYAKLANTTLAAKTGTSTDWDDLNFVGVTPDYVSGVWIGYEIQKQIPTSQYQNIGQIWKNIFGDIAETEPTKDFTEPGTVVEARYCTKTGLLASSGCSSTDIGYYKQSNLPGYCNGVHS